MGTGTTSLPNGGLSSVGESLLTTGQAPNPVPATSTAAPTNSAGLTSYQSEFLNLQQYDDQELLYASQLSFSAGLENADSVFLQAAALLGSPGSPGTLQSPISTQTGSTQSSQTSATQPTSSNSSTSTASNALSNLPSVSSILAASDDEAEQTLNAYANAPVGSSILDYQA